MDPLAFFQTRLGASPAVLVRAPGRVNLIGEHIDYNGGHVLPIAIARGITLAASPRHDRRYRLYALDLNREYSGGLPRLRLEEHFWANYIFGVITEFQKLGHNPTGYDIAFSGDLPRSSGLSSSAALEVAAAFAAQFLLGTNLSSIELALLAQRAENRFVGVNCGIMDQAVAAGAQTGHAMLLDCTRLQTDHIPLDFKGKAVVLVAHSGVRRGLSASAYNERREQCELALQILRARTGREIAALCDATLEQLEQCREAMGDLVYRRARHAVTEEQRVQAAVLALRQADPVAFGRLLNESHASLRDDYEVSCPELEELTERIRSHPGVYGSRLTGAGFGGCTVSLVQPAAAGVIIEDLEFEFYNPRKIAPVAFVTEAHGGVARIA